jgi:hypothetical protein
MAVVRILVAIEPLMYQEVLAFHVRQERPLSELTLASSQTLKAEANRTMPHLIVANEVPPELKEMHYSLFWVEVHVDDGLVASVSADGHSTIIEEGSLQDLLEAVDKAEEELAHHEA